MSDLHPPHIVIDHVANPDTADAPNTVHRIDPSVLRKEIEADDTLELRIAETDPGADGTDMYIALQSALSDAPRERIAGAVMITDGQIHDIPQDTKDAQKLGPIHAMIVGGDDEIDRNIEIQSAPSFSIRSSRLLPSRYSITMNGSPILPAIWASAPAVPSG